jgi:phosphoglycerate dehydrogenase-like enzyme
MNELHSLLPRCDFLILSLPLTPHTKGILAEKELALLQPHAFVVNIGRGELIDQHALYTALKENRIAGAALDVWYHYPTDIESRSHTAPADEPFGELETVIMSPHKAGGLAVDEVEQERMQALAHLLNDLVQGDVLPKGIDIQAGY